MFFIEYSMKHFTSNIPNYRFYVYKIYTLINLYILYEKFPTFLYAVHDRQLKKAWELFIYDLRAPSATPLTMCFCMNKNTTIIGIIDIKTAGNINSHGFPN